MLVECDVWRECIVPEAETMEIGRERDRETRGGRGRPTGPFGVLFIDTEDSMEWVISEGDAGKALFWSEIPSVLDEATLVMLL